MRFPWRRLKKSSLGRENLVTEAEEGRERKRVSIASQCKDMKILKRIRIIKKPLVLANKKFFVALVKEIQ